MRRFLLCVLILSALTGCGTAGTASKPEANDSIGEDYESKVSDLEYQVAELEDEIVELKSKLSDATDQAQVVHSAIEQADAQMGMFSSMDWADVVPMVQTDIMTAQEESSRLIALLE